MNDNEHQCAETPLEELLVKVPVQHRLIIELPLESHHIPVGVHCHKAAETIIALKAEVKRRKKALANKQTP